MNTVLETGLNYLSLGTTSNDYIAGNGCKGTNKKWPWYLVAKLIRILACHLEPGREKIKKNGWMLCISTSEWVLCMLFASQNQFFDAKTAL